MSNYNCLTMMILRKCRANYEELTSLINIIATSRIDRYDGDTVTFHYNRHEDEQYVEETLPVMDFIKRLIRHIPEKHFM